MILLILLPDSRAHLDLLQRPASNSDVQFLPDGCQMHVCVKYNMNMSENGIYPQMIKWQFQCIERR